MDDLKQQLEHLHSELQNTENLDPATVEALKVLASDISMHLERAEQAPPDADGSISSRLKTMVEDFEMQHPRLTTIVSQLAERLADMGI
ncbi:DUF4404 family protein [Pirellulaceae bacterium SH449]